MSPLGKHFASSVFAVVLAVLAVIISEQSTSAQLVGTDICACQPSVYKFKLNFSLSCIDTTVEGPGITETACNVNSRDTNENVTNPFPISVSEVQVLELGQTLQVVGSSVFGGTFFDGDEISYTSITVTEPGTINAATIPRGFQVFITGINSDEDPLVNQWAITYNNDCGIFPLLEIGDLIGWSNFVSKSALECKRAFWANPISNLPSHTFTTPIYIYHWPFIQTDLGKPAEEFCPIAGPDTAAPVVPATAAPVVPETAAPVVAETGAPTFPPPTQAPLVGGTEAPKAEGPPTCPPFESYGSEDDKSEGSASRDIKGGSSKSGIRDIKGGAAGSSKTGRGASTSGSRPSSKSGKSAVGVAGQTESMNSESSGTASKQRRWLATGGGNCPEPPANYPSSSKGGANESGDAARSKGSSVSKGGGGTKAGKRGSSKGRSVTAMSEGSVVSKGSSKATSANESTLADDTPMSKTESESESSSSNTEPKARRLRKQ